METGCFLQLSEIPEGGACFDPAVYTNPVEVYSSSQLAAAPAKILSRLWRLTHGSCFVTCVTVKVDGEEDIYKKKITLPPPFCFLSPPFLSDRHERQRAARRLPSFLPSFSSHRSSAILHLLLKAVIHPTTRSQNWSPAPGPLPPPSGAELCMVGSSETGGFATASAVTYITPQ